MIEVDSIVRDPNVAVEFARQIFPPEVQQSMVGRQDYEVFREGIHEAGSAQPHADFIGSVKPLHCPVNAFAKYFVVLTTYHRLLNLKRKNLLSKLDRYIWVPNDRVCLCHGSISHKYRKA